LTTTTQRGTDRAPGRLGPMATVAIGLVAAALVAVLIASGALLPSIPSPSREPKSARPDHVTGVGQRTFLQRAKDGRKGPAHGAESAGFAQLIARLSLLIVLALAVVAVRRTLARRSRCMQRFVITPGRTSDAVPAQVAGLIEALLRVTRERWWIRMWRGTPPAATLELVSGVSPEGSSEQRVGVAIPVGHGHGQALQGVLSSRYPDAVLTPVDERQGFALDGWLREVICLQKARPFAAPIAHPLDSAPDGGTYAEAPLDVVLSVMAAANERVLVQIVVTPTPNLFQHLARLLAGTAPERRRRLKPGAVDQREDHAAAEAVVFRPLSFCDIRIGAESRAAARHVAGAIEAVAEGAENQLRQRRPVLRRWLVRRRMVKAESDPAPSWIRGVYSSLEIAGLWHLPTPYAKRVAIERSNVPQLPTPPEVLKLPDERRALATDLRGTYIGIRPRDYRLGVQVRGMAGGGKTSFLAKLIEARAREPNTAVIVLDPKGELAEAAAASAPSWRTVRFLDFGKPLFGMELRTPDRNLPAEAAIFSEAMVDVSRTEEGESQALNASQRSFKMARGATLALEEEPTFWHTARWLAPDDAAAVWRAEKIAELAGDPQWHAVWDHFARILPAQLKKSPAQTVMRLEAPYNKIQTLLGDERLNTVLHHPVTISFDDVIRRREILILAARIPEHPDAEVLLKFYIQLIHRAILGQHALPEDERARVAVAGDDAGHLFSPTIARMAELDRSAGLDFALAWQHGGQVSPELSQALDALCNSRVYFRSSKEDAREFIERLNPAFDDRLSGTVGELRRQRVEVNQMTSLPVNHAVASLQCGDVLSTSFTIKTLPWHRDPERIAEIERRMRAEGGYDPQVIAPPAELTGRGDNVDVPDVGHAGSREPEAYEPKESAATEPPSKRTSRSAPPRSEDAKEVVDRQPGEPNRAASSEPRKSRPVRRGRREAEVAELGTPTTEPLSPAYEEIELMREKASSINWEDPPPEPPDAKHYKLNAEKRSILEALFELRVLSGAQIQREFLLSMSDRQARREMNLLLRQRMVRRFELGLRGGRGRGKRIYVLDTAGFEELRNASDHQASGTFRPPELRSPQHVVHDLARNEWLFAFRSLAPKQLVSWRGPRTGRIEVPLVKEAREAPRRLTPVDLGESAPLGFGETEFGNVIPDLTLEVNLKRPDGGVVRTDVLVEIEFGNNDETVRRKAVQYDGFLTGWWRRHPRYHQLGRPPVVIFAVPDLSRARRFVELLDKQLTAHLVGPAETQTREQRQQDVRPEPRHLYLGRRNVIICVASDVHQRTLRGWRIPPEPVPVRISAARNAAERHQLERPVARPFMLVDPTEQVRPAR
jgi:hypothetical protein